MAQTWKLESMKGKWNGELDLGDGAWLTEKFTIAVKIYKEKFNAGNAAIGTLLNIRPSLKILKRLTPYRRTNINLRPESLMTLLGHLQCYAADLFCYKYFRKSFVYKLKMYQLIKYSFDFPILKLLLVLSYNSGIPPFDDAFQYLLPAQISSTYGLICPFYGNFHKHASSLRGRRTLV